jgi:hypothetical protein
MEVDWESQATGGESARAELREYLESLVKRFDAMERPVPREEPSEAPSGNAPPLDVSARRERLDAPGPTIPPARTLSDWPPPPASDEIVALQAEVRDELRGLRQDLWSQHREILNALERVWPSVGPTPGTAAQIEAEGVVPAGRSASSSVDEYQRELLDDLQRATRRLLNWYLALASELSATQSAR